MRITKFHGLALAACMYLAPAPVFAASSSADGFRCVGTYIPGQTSPVRANSVNHFIHVSAAPGSAVLLWDTSTFVTVYVATAGTFGISKTITGLYGSYRLNVNSAWWCSWSHGSIDNN